MPTPALSLRIKRYRRRFGVLSPKLVIRRDFSRLSIVLAGLVLAVLMTGLGWLAAGYWGPGGLGRDIGFLVEQLQRQGEELGQLRAIAGAGQNAVGIERATQQQLLQKIGVLEAENAALKEDMRLFERLVPRVSDGAYVRIENFRVTKDSGGRYRYRLLILFQPDKQMPEFRGRLQLVVVYALSGKVSRLTVPDGGDTSGEYHVEVRSFLRREGVFELPPEAVVQSVESRLLQGDALKSKQLAQL